MFVARGASTPPTPSGPRDGRGAPAAPVAPVASPASPASPASLIAPAEGSRDSLADASGPWAHWKRDLVRVPGLLSLTRVPMAVAFPFVADRPLAALGLVVLSGVSDVLDGWYARTFKQTTAMGTVLDPLADKVFVAVVLVSLVAGGNLTPVDAVLLCTREIGELPLVAFVAVRRAPEQPALAPPMANAAGKLVTGLQFVTIAAAILRSPSTTGLVIATATAGAIAAVSYWVRAVTPSRRA